MINRTKLSVIAVSAVLAVALTGCGGSASSAPSSVSSASASAPVSDAASPAADTAENGTADLDSAVETLLAADPISNQFEIAAMNIEYDFGLKAEDVAAYKGVKSKLSMATTPSLHRHRATWKTPSSPPRVTVWSW